MPCDVRIRRVRVRTNARGVIGDVLAHNVVGDGSVFVLGPLSERIRPAFAHPASLVRLQTPARTTPGHAIGDAVRVLVHGDVVLKCAVALGAGQVPKEHRHLAALPIGGRREERVVGALVVLDGDQDTVVACPALAKVVVLEVERSLVEAVDVGDVMHRVDDVECIRARGVDVLLRRRVRVRVLSEDKVLPSGRLLCGVGGVTLVRNSVVPAGVGGRSSTVAVPAVRRRGGISGVGERLEALKERFFGDWKNAVLSIPND